MSTTRIVAAITVVLLAVSGVALASGGSGVDVRSDSDVSATADAGSGVAASVDATTSGSAGTSDGVAAAFGASTDATIGATSTTIDDDSSTTTSSTPTTVATTSTTVQSTTSTTFDDRGGDDDRRGDDEIRAGVTLGLRTYDVAEAGTVTVEGMTVVSVNVNPGWTFEVDEASSDRIRVEFHSGEQEAEFELEVGGELRIELGG